MCVCVYFDMYNHVRVLFNPADRVLVLPWVDMLVQLHLMHSVLF